MLNLLTEQAYIFIAVFVHVLVAGLLAIIIDYVFPKYDEKRSNVTQICEIALQISTGALLITKLHILSKYFIPVLLVASVPFGVVEGVVMITPQPELHKKVDHVQASVRKLVAKCYRALGGGSHTACVKEKKVTY